ncbi:glucosamine-6-phosphate deaminase [Deinococcus altitudinis]|uniref:glucosamine-6-phosphate deaminase n=1 Tax=Deinococcus altitudinis TaxID=468914 RepID=UPI003891ACE3
MRPGLILRAAADPQALAVQAADLIAERVRVKPELSLLVATGSTPMLTYAELARRVQAGTLDLSRVTAVQLDEYLGPDSLGLDDTDQRSLWGWMQRSFVGPLRITRTVRFQFGEDAQQTCTHYDAQVSALGGIDLAVLGLGPNGHLGFNEPPSGPDAPTRVVPLSPESQVSNRVYWDREVPRQAVTAGMTVILAARASLLLVTGEHKRSVLRRVLNGPATPELPASLLGGPDVTVLADRAALGSALAGSTAGGS